MIFNYDLTTIIIFNFYVKKLKIITIVISFFNNNLIKLFDYLINLLMNLNTLYSLSKKNEYTDLILIICSDEDNIFDFSDQKKITINVHKCVLYSSSTYFKNLFTLGSESNQDKITIQVPNVSITQDIIASFYGQIINSTDYPDWLYQLDYIRCCDYLGITFDTKNIRNIVVPEKYFEFLISVVEITNYDDNLIECLSKNIPNGYDLSKLSNKIKNKLAKYNMLIISCNKNTINIHNVLNKSLVNTCKMKGKNIIDMSYSSNLLATANSNCIVKIFDIPSLVLIKTLKIKEKDNNYCRHVCFSPDGSTLVSEYYNGMIKIWNTNTWKIITEFENTVYGTTNICFMNKNIIVISHDKKFHIDIIFVDISTGKEIKKEIYTSFCKIHNFRYNENYDQLIVNQGNGVIVFWHDDKNCTSIDIKEKCKYIKNIQKYSVIDINLSSDGNYLVVTSSCGDIMVYCCKTREYICSMNNTNTCAIKNAYFYHNSMITIDSNGQIKIWSGETGEMTNDFNSDLSDIRKMLLVPHP
ncbi:putative BTB/POZ domain and WD-repeat protein [Megavirus courdo11]|uniref:Putative BTB/POZ domain and WD-repeat protein n=1 Tax=Megavirus courdo11 TaxID=1128140 RepID=K7Z9D2_9VIRU|nr:putative BTB/POZ domain and WD-repeat protein [Megavirus courdo11]